MEAITAFSDQFVTQIQTNQRQRYNELMMAFTMSAAETARKTREFRSPPQDQVHLTWNKLSMYTVFSNVTHHIYGTIKIVLLFSVLKVNMLMSFKNCIDDDESPVPDEVRESLLSFHNGLLVHCG